MEQAGLSSGESPFQKALPYFPDFGYQATIHFKGGVEILDKETQEMIVALIKNLNGKLLFLYLVYTLLINLIDECAKIDSRFPLASDGKKVAHSGFNMGFELNFWQKWCQLLSRKPSGPVIEATKMMNSEDNFMKKHSKLRYTEKGHVWFYLKAETEEDSEVLLKARKTVSCHCIY